MSGNVALWHLQGDRLLFREKLHGEFAVNAVAFAPDGSLMASAGGDCVQLRRVAKPAEVVQGFATRPGSAPANALVPAARADGQTTEIWRALRNSWTSTSPALRSPTPE